MNDVYIVVSINDGAIPEVCEVYSDKQQAFGRAAALAHFAAVHHPEWDTSPKEKVDVYGNQHWVFLKTSSIFNMRFVGVYYKKIEGKVVSKSFSLPATLPSPLKDDPMDLSLPAGWTYNGKPITMAKLLEDPYIIRPTSDLSDSQKWALVTSRINKRLWFTARLPGWTLFQFAALQELKNKTKLGEEIVLLECAWLDKVLNEQKDKEGEESSSESSSEEDY